MNTVALLKDHRPEQRSTGLLTAGTLEFNTHAIYPKDSLHSAHAPKSHEADGTHARSQDRRNREATQNDNPRAHEDKQRKRNERDARNNAASTDVVTASESRQRSVRSDSTATPSARRDKRSAEDEATIVPKRPEGNRCVDGSIRQVSSDGWDPREDLSLYDHLHPIFKSRDSQAFQINADVAGLVAKLDAAAAAGRGIDELALVGAEVVILGLILSAAAVRKRPVEEMARELQMQTHWQAQINEAQSRRAAQTINTSESPLTNCIQTLQHHIDRPWFNALADNLGAITYKDSNARPGKDKDADKFTIPFDRPERRIRNDDFDEQAAVKQQKRAIWIVRPNEDLVKLAEQQFQDTSFAWLIVNINQARINQCQVDGKQIVQLQVRQLIELPTWDEMAEFKRTKEARRDTRQLITIVQDTAVERELANIQLGLAMGVKVEQRKPALTAAKAVDHTIINQFLAAFSKPKADKAAPAI